MDQAGIAVIVPVFNRAKTVLETLATIERQTVSPRRLIIVDDGSTDGSAQSIRNWIARIRPGFQAIVIEQPNQGVSAARNRGLREIGDFRYVAFLDSDDHWPGDFLARAFLRMQVNPAAVAVTADRLYLRQSKSRHALRSSRGLERNATRFLIAENPGIASCTLFRSAIVARLGGFDSRLKTGEDIELFLRISLEGPWLHAPGDPVRFYVGFTTANGEEGNLSYKHADRQRRWVKLREQFIYHQGGIDHLPPRWCRRRLARQWHKTAAAFESAGQDVRAAACFYKALKYNPLRPATWLQLALLRAWKAMAAVFFRSPRAIRTSTIPIADAPSAKSLRSAA
jgi:glycosyltransferase involved in cell wall biosynthesis